ncbi:unnamed protein product [Lymnaea stagnalis]|uniref:Uncharacterized protein n=1 Tax=Lymnaea stagnalis TaxID=6523 RepID=A0AAV2I749_LYMST
MSGKENHRKRKLNMEDNHPVAERRRSSLSLKLSEAIAVGNIEEAARLLQSSSVPSQTLSNAFIKAVELGQKRILQMLVTDGANVNKRDNRGYTALMISSEHGYVDLAKILVRNGINVNCQNKLGQTALIIGAEKACSLPFLEYLLSEESNADVNIQDKSGKTALMMSIERHDYCAMKLFIYRKRTDFNLKDKSNRTATDIARQCGNEDLFHILKGCSESDHFITPLMLAVKKGTLGLVKLILEAYGPETIDLTDVRGFTPLMMSLDSSIKIDIVKVLLKAGASVNKANKNDVTPLFLATQAGNCEAVQCLITQGANVNVQTASEKITPLMIASKENLIDLMQILIVSKADVNMKNIKNETALVLAMKNASGSAKDCVQLLLSNGAEINDTIFHMAAVVGLHNLFPNISDTISISMRNKLLIHGIQNNNHDLVEFLLENGADVNQGGPSSPVPLIQAVKNEAMVTLLLSFGAKVNDKNYLDTTALIESVRLDNCGVINILIKQGADMNVETRFGDTALIIAAKLEKLNALKALLDGKVDVDFITHSGKSALHASIIVGRLTAMELLLKHGADVNLGDHSSLTPLMLSVYVDSEAIPNLLVEHGADPNKQSADGMTALMFALKLRDYSKNGKIKKLVAAGTDLSKTNCKGETALMIAVQNCTTVVIDFLIKNGADVNAQDKNGSSVLIWAVAHSIANENKIALLIEQKADVNKANDKGETPLILASKSCNVNIMQLLISKGANVNAQDYKGMTALMYAVYLDYYEKSQLLIASNAELDIQNNNGDNAVMLAVGNGDAKVLKALILAGANIHACNEKGDGPLSLALSNLYVYGWSHIRDYSVVVSFACLRKLLKAGGAPDMRDPRNALLFHKLIVIPCHQPKTMELFISTGAAPPVVPLGAL